MGNSDAGGMHGTSSEYSTLFHLRTSLVPFLAPTGTSKHKGDDSRLMDDNNCSQSPSSANQEGGLSTQGRTCMHN